MQKFGKAHDFKIVSTFKKWIDKQARIQEFSSEGVQPKI